MKNNLDILYEDNHLIVVIKKPNILSQGDITKDNDMLTIIKSYLKEKYQKKGNVYLGLVHRLDRPTSGIMVFAKTSKAARRLSEQIKNKEFKKSYLAVVYNLKEAKGIFIDYIKKLENNTSKIVSKEEGKYAELNYEKLETIKSLKDKISALNDEVATFKEKAQGKEEIEKELSDIKNSIKKREFEEFIEKQIDKGILVPANKNVVLSVLQELDNVKKFGEDSAVITDFKSFIESLPNQIKYGELATKEKQADPTDEDVEKFANADEDSLQVFKEAKALAAKNNISFKEALLKLNK